MTIATITPCRQLLGHLRVACALALFAGTIHTPIPAQDRKEPKLRYGTDGVRALYGINSNQFEGTAEDAARAFVAGKASLLRVDSPSASLKIRRVERVPGGSHVRFSQMYHDIPVYRSEIVVSMNGLNQVGMLLSTARADIRPNSLTPAFGAEKALNFARTALNATGPPLGKSQQVALTIFRLPTGEDRLAYRVACVLEDPPGDWEVIIDAQTGAELFREDRYVNQGDSSPFFQGSGYVYLRNPLSASRHRYGDPGFSNNDNADSDSLNAYRSVVTLDSLTLENGLYSLSGPSCVITDLESPVDSLPYREASPDAFRYRRSQPGFEAVMAYYHVTLAHQRLRSLGFDPPTLYALQVDPHGYQGKDNSHYSPGGNWIAFGTGGVEDAEDADVIWHEYAHAIQYGIIPFWGGGECAALGEGFGDYWAASHARSLQEWTPGDSEYQWIFGWDGHNPYWSGRILNDGGTYPFPAGSVHAAGQIWTAALMGIRDDLGRDITDRLVIKSLYYLAPEVTATDNAEALLQADRDLYGGAHLSTLMYWLRTVKNFLPADGARPILLVSDELPRQDNTLAAKGIDTPPRATFSSVVPSLSLAAGFDLQTTSFAAFDTSSLSATAILLLLGGVNPAPFNDQARRNAIVRFAERGGKVLIEGGEVGSAYTWRSAGGELDSSFRLTLLHTRAFLGDGTGTSLVPTQSDGALFSQPHAIPAPLAFLSPSASVDRDLMEVTHDPSTLTAGLWSDERGTAAIVAHLNDAGTVQTLYLPFSLASLADSSLAAQLAENALSFLLYYQRNPAGIASDGPALPDRFRLLQNYPNPFNPATTFAFDLPERSRVLLEVFTPLGQRVCTAVEGVYPAGHHEVRWDAAAQAPARLSSGIYLFRMIATGEHGGRESATRTMALVH